MPLLPFAPAPSSGSSSPLTTKGDLFTHGSSDTRLAVGSDGFILTSDSAQTLGIGWGTRDANLNNKNAINMAGWLVGSTTFPSVASSPPNNTPWVSPIAVTNGTYTVTPTSTQNIYAPLGVNDQITVSGAAFASFECASLLVRPVMTFSDGAAGEVATGLDVGFTTQGTNTLGQVYGAAIVPIVGTSVTNLYTVSAAFQTTASAITVTTATLFRGVTIQGVGSTISNIVGIDLTSMGSGSTSTWNVKMGTAPSYHQGPWLAGGATALPTATTGGTTLSEPSRLALVSSTTRTTTLVGGQIYAPWLLNDTTTTAGAVTNAQVYGLALYPKLTASSSTTNLTAAGVSASPTFAGTDTYGTIYGLALSASITASATAAIGVQSSMVVSGGTTTTLTGFKFSPTVFGGTVTTTVGLDLTSLAGSTIWGMKVGNYQSYHQGAHTFGAAAAPVYGIDLQALNSGSLSVIGVAGNNNAAANPASNQSYWALWKGATNYYFLIAFNDAGTQRFISIGPLNGAGAASLTKGTSLPV